MSKRPFHGFTLIELVTTIAVASILLSIAIPGVERFTLNARQSGAINEFVSAMHLARNTAITTNERITVCASGDGADCESVAWDRGWIVFVDNDRDQDVDGDDTIIGTGAAIEGLEIDSGQFSRFFMYRPNGRVMNATVDANSGEFTVCDLRGDAHAKVVIMDLAGRPRLSATLADGSAPSCRE